MNILKKLMPFLSPVFFVVATISVFQSWLSSEIFGQSNETSLWDTESDTRYFVLGIAAVGVAIGAAAVFARQNTRLYSLLSLALAISGIIVSVLYVMGEKEDFDEFGIELKFAVGLYLAVLTFFLAGISSLLGLARGGEKK